MNMLFAISTSYPFKTQTEFTSCDFLQAKLEEARKTLHNIQEDFSSCKKHKQELENSLESKVFLKLLIN